MRVLDACRSSLQSIAVNKLRSALTMLGVIIGVASVIAMVAVGNGASEQVQSRILALGSNLVTVTPQNTTSGGLRGAGDTAGTLTLADMQALQSQLGGSIAAIEAEQQAGRWQVTAGTQNWNTQVTGVSALYPTVRDWNVQAGLFFTDAEESQHALVAVIGADTAQQLFGDAASAVGQTIKLRQSSAAANGGDAVARILSFKVVGVLESKGATGGFARDDQILVPLGTSEYVLTGRTNAVSSIVVKSASKDQLTGLTSDVTDVLLQRHHATDPANADFAVQNQNDTLSALDSVSQTFTMLLGAIGGISLLVGGIGIMNIMLVSVNERTREIGIRKAVGARRIDILSQFLMEATTLTGVGGLMGIALGWAIAVTARIFQSSLQTQVTGGSIAIAVGVSAGIGITFGLYPAMRAAQLHPIQALRHE